jgi:hypothetical protein
MTEGKINGMAEKIKEAANAAGASYRENYSGRYMFGDCCPGVVGDVHTLAEVLANLPSVLRKTFKQDNMGMEYIYYWPNLATKKEHHHE